MNIVQCYWIHLNTIGRSYVECSSQVGASAVSACLRRSVLWLRFPVPCGTKQRSGLSTSTVLRCRHWDMETSWYRAVLSFFCCFRNTKFHKFKFFLVSLPFSGKVEKLPPMSATASPAFTRPPQAAHRNRSRTGGDRPCGGNWTVSPVGPWRKPSVQKGLCPRSGGMGISKQESEISKKYKKNMLILISYDNNNKKNKK